MLFYNAQRYIICAMHCNNTCYLFKEGVSTVVQCNAKQKVHNLCYFSMQNFRSLVQCNATNTYFIFLMNTGLSQLWCVLQCNCKKCITSLHNVRSFVQCNAKCNLFYEHGKELDLLCNAMQCNKCITYVIFQCTTLYRLCNALQQHMLSL